MATRLSSVIAAAGVAVVALTIILSPPSKAQRAGGRDEARSQCESGDTNNRLVGCTAVINAKGFGSKFELAAAYDARCWAFNDLQQFQRAIVDCKASIALQPRYPYAYHNLGVAFVGLGDVTAAIAAFTKAIEFKSTFIYPYLDRAKAFASLGNKELAKRDFEHVLVIDPTNQDASQGIAALSSTSQQQVAVQPQQPQVPLEPSTQQLPFAQTRQNRIALLIGNQNYRYAAALANPINDAQLLAKVLRDVGFKSVTVKTDLTREQTMQALREFANAADSAEWAVVYYSGHGMEFGGSNYIIPIDAQLKVDRDVALETIEVEKIESAIQGAKRLRLVVLDACRNNPFASQMKRTVGTRSVAKGLAQMEPEAGTLIAYAAKHGEFALDGTGSNSPFVEALTRRIRERPTQEIRRLFDLVRDDVMESTGQKQQPFTYGSLSGREDFYFWR
jgi:tetratricopeptide (TPR) repeat protein